VADEGFAGHSVIVLAYALGERVYLVDAECWGRVREINIAQGGKLYLVAWFDEDRRRCDSWFTERELTKSPR